MKIETFNKIQEKNNILAFFPIFIPILIEQFFQTLIGNVDILLLSQYSDDGVAAVGIANQIIVIGSMILSIVSIGTLILLSQLCGASNIYKTKLVIKNSIYLNLAISFGLFIFLIVFGETFLKLIQTPKNLNEYANTYIKIVGFSLIFQSIMTSFATVFRSFTYVKYIMNISIIVNILNIIGSGLVVLTPITILGKGVEGVANATLISRVIGASIYVYLFARVFEDYFIDILKVKLDFSSIKSIFKLGLPSGMESISYNVSQTLLTSIIAGFGSVAVTSKIYAQTMTSYVFMISSAISLAIQVIIGRLIGSDLKEKASKYGCDVLYKGVSGVFLISLILALLSKNLVGIFTDNKSIVTLVINLVFLSVLLEPARAANCILIAGLNSAGDVKFPVVVGIIVTYIITVPMSYIIGIKLGYGIQGIWFVSIVDEWIRATIFYLRWKKGNWKNIDII